MESNLFRAAIVRIACPVTYFSSSPPTVPIKPSRNILLFELIKSALLEVSEKLRDRLKVISLPYRFEFDKRQQSLSIVEIIGFYSNLSSIPNFVYYFRI